MRDAAPRALAAGGLRAEVRLLVALAFVLPVVEAPKNIFWFLFIGVWFVNRVRARDFGGAWKTWDSIIATLVFGTLAGTAFSGLSHDEWKGSRDVVRYGLLLWALTRTRYVQRDWHRVMVAALAGSVVAGAYGAWRVWSGTTTELELNSVGHSNHSAIYLSIVIGAGLAWAIAFWRAMSLAERSAWCTALFACTVALVLSASRAALAVTLLLTLVTGVCFLPRSRKPLLIVIALMTVGIGYLAVEQPWVVKKQMRNVEGGYVLANRDFLWERAVVAWREYPMFGVGMNNFGQISSARYRNWIERQGGTYQVGRDYGSSHAHSLYLNTLAERGAAGLAILLVFLGAWFAAQLRSRPAREDDIGWATWGASLAAWFVTVAAGVFNTTLHSEHALLAVLFLGAWLAHREQRPRQ